MIYPNVGALLKGQQTVGLGPRASVQEAAEKMAEHRIGAVPILESGKLTGLFTERDLLNRVVARGLRPEEVLLAEAMTPDPLTVTSDVSLVKSLAIMLEHRFRHLPVLEDGRLVGVLSCRDIPADYWMMWEKWISAQNELKSVTG